MLRGCIRSIPKNYAIRNPLKRGTGELCLTIGASRFNRGHPSHAQTMPKPCPYIAPGTLSAADAGELIRRGRKLLRKGLLTHREMVLLDCMLWSARKPGAAEAVVSYATLQRLAHISRETIAKGLRRLGQLGLVQTIKRRVRVIWGGRVASRQATSAYRFAAPATEFGEATVILETKILPLVPTAEQRAAEAALAARRAVIEERLLRKGATA